jgi:hypothetical protein
MIHALEHLSKGSLADLINNLETEGNLVVLLDAVVTVRVVIAVVYNPLCLSRVYLMLIGGQIIDFFEFGDFLLF